jgi:3-methyladenine DNA glycosylase Tag
LKNFVEIKERAEYRKGGIEKLSALMPRVASKKELISLGDDRYLAMMTKSINQAGFSWKVIEKNGRNLRKLFWGLTHLS